LKRAAHRVAINTAILYLRLAVTVFISLYTVRIVLNALGAEDFGLFNLVGGTIAMLTFLNASMAGATQRFMSYAHGQGDEDQQNKIFNVSVLLHLIIAIIVLIILEIVGHFIFDHILHISQNRMHAAWLIYQFACASTFFTIISVPYDSVINARENMLLFALMGVIEAILKLIIAFIIIDVKGDRLVVYGFLITLLTLILFLWRFFYCHIRYRECYFSPSHLFNQKALKEMSSFAGWSFIGTASSMIAFYGQMLVLNFFFGAMLNAAQGLANQISGQLSVFSSNMLRALSPVIVKNEGAGKRDTMVKASILGTKISYFLLMLFYVPVLVEMSFLFKLWLKNVPQFTVTFCSLLLIQKLLEQFYVTIASSIAAVGDIKNYQIISSLLTVLPLPISSILFLSGFDPEYMYYVFIVYTLFILVVTLFFAKKIFGMDIEKYFSGVLLRCVISFLLTISITSLPLIFLESGLLRLLLVFSISIPASLFSIWQFGFDKEEKTYLSKIVTNIFLRVRNFMTSYMRINFY
jgi:Na+-driven multidrug efflux pump